MLWVSYGRFSKEGIQGMIANPQNRAGAVEKLMKAYKGNLVSYHLIFNGDIDFFIVSDIPDDRVSDLGLVNALLVRGSGSIESITTVAAYKAEDAMPLMQRAQQMISDRAYNAPAVDGYFPREGA